VLQPTGAESWSQELPEIITIGPTLGRDGTVYVGRNRTLYAVQDGGGVKWTYSAGLDTFRLEQLPVVGPDNRIYIAGSYYAEAGPGGAVRGEGLVCVLNPDGSEAWTFSTEESMGSLIVGADGAVYVSTAPDFNEGPWPDPDPVTGPGLFALDKDGNPLWLYPSYTVSVQVLSENGFLYAVDFDGLVVFRAADGAEMWSFKAGIPYMRSGFALSMDGTLFVDATSRILTFRDT
jgi:outer membrane protein assembly factor BamB